VNPEQKGGPTEGGKAFSPFVLGAFGRGVRGRARKSPEELIRLKKLPPPLKAVLATQDGPHHNLKALPPWQYIEPSLHEYHSHVM
jgi:hypothetical protein